ncbi:MAG: hypothetical protein PHS05_10475 [Bacteroidales bacterium]|nr:hypothetical protein [Bacteroidales bacterium]
MRITTPNGTLAVNADTEISLTLTNPMFEEQGSHALPFTVPWCEHNLHVLGHPELLSKAERPNIFYSCIVEADGVKENGVFQFVDFSFGDSIELSLIIREGHFWNWAKNENLRDISIPISPINTTPATFQFSKNTIFNNIWPEVNYAYTPIATNFLSLDHYKQSGNYGFWAGQKYCISDYILWNNPGDLYRNDSTRTSVVAPQLYLNAVIQWIANSFGYVINENMLSSTDELKSLIILNKAYATNLVEGYVFQPKYLLPNVSVIDFIEAIELEFGCVFTVDSKRKQLNICAIKGKFYKSNKKVEGSLIPIGLTDALSLKFKTNKVSSPYSTTTERAVNNSFFTYETQNAPIIHDKVYVTASTPNYTTHPNKIVFSVALQSYFYMEWVDAGSDWEYKARCIHSNLYDRTINEDFETKTIEPKSVLAPMVPITCRQFYKDGDKDEYFNFEMIVPFFSDWDYLFDFQDGFVGLNKNETPICFAFNRGRIVTVAFPDTLFGIKSFNIPVSSVDVYNRLGTKISAASIALRYAGDYNLYENFYKELEQFYNNKSLKTEIVNYNTEEILDSEITDPALTNGTRYFFNEVKISIKPDGTQVTSASVTPIKCFPDD